MLLLHPGTTLMHITKLLIVAWPFLVSCHGAGPRTNSEAERANATSFPVVSAIERLALLQAHFYPHLVVDSTSLASVARMTGPEIRELRERLREKVSVGEATLTGACQRRSDAVCWSMRVLSFDLAGDSARVSVKWAPVAKCGHWTRTFLLNDRAAIVKEYAGIVGDC